MIMKLRLPVKEKFKFALKLNRWPVTWFDTKKEKEEKRQERVQRLYPSIKKM